MAGHQHRRPSPRSRSRIPFERRRKVYHFIINESSGSGNEREAGLKLAKKLERRLKRSGWDCFTRVGSSIDEFDKLVATAVRERPFAVIAFGGDGSIRRAAAQVAKVDGLLGIVPLGRYNDIYQSLYGTVDADEALDLIANGYQMRINAATANGRFFLGNLVTGVVPAFLDRLGPQRLPRLAMSWTSLAGKAADTAVPRTTTFKIDAYTFQAQPLLLNVHLLPRLLSLRFAPVASPQDDRLVVIYDKDATRDTIAHYIRDLRKDRYQYSDAIQLIRGQKVVVSPATGRKWLMDGDDVEFSGEDVIIEVHKGALRVFSDAARKS